MREREAYTSDCVTKVYDPKELVAVRIGPAESPLNVTAQYPGGWFSRFFWKRRRLPLFVGKGFNCPHDHELIGMVTWRT